jgi:hypothetical protein
MAGVGDAIGGFASGVAGSLKAKDDNSESPLSRWIGKKLSRSETAAGSSSEPAKGDLLSQAATAGETAGSMKKGGRVKRTGIYRMHKDEIVVPVHVVKAAEKAARTPRKKARKASRTGSRR